MKQKSIEEKSIEEIEQVIRRVDPRNYPDENMRQIIYGAKNCLNIRKQVKEELETARTYRKESLDIMLEETEKLIRKGEAAIERKEVDEKFTIAFNNGIIMAEAVVSGEYTGRIGTKKKRRKN